MIPVIPSTTRFRKRPVDEEAVRALASDAGLSLLLARLLVARGIGDAASAHAFLTPDLSRDWMEPEAVEGMAAACQAVADAVRSGARIVVFGDFDLDGISAASVATLGLRSMGAIVEPVVPHRFREGYGLSEAAMDRLLRLSPAMVVTVDCGISSAHEVEELLSRGVRVVVTDHHEPGDLVPRGVPVANARLGGPEAPGTDLAGAGVALKLVQGAGSILGYPDIWLGLVDLAALGTVADVVPLLGENRALVAAGLSMMRSAPRPGLAALAEVASVDISRVSSEDVAFWLAPRLNAAGRMTDPAHALELLMEEDPDEAVRIARTLEEQNRLRQAVEQDLFEEARGQAEERISAGDAALVLSGEGWHDGVKGIVASRLAAEFGVPAVLFSVEEGVATGSGRTAAGIDLFAAISACSSLLHRFGGHAAAVGASLPVDRLDEFREAFLLSVAEAKPAEPPALLEIEALAALDELSLELAEEIRLLEPFGHGNRRPLIGTERVFMNGRKRVGRDESHLRFTAYDGIASVPAIAFRLKGIEALSECCSPVDLVYELRADEWRGQRRLTLHVKWVGRREVASEEPAAALVEELFERADELLARGDEDYAGIGEAEAFHTKLAGVSFEGRQGRVRELAPGTVLRLERQPENVHDGNACAVFDPAGGQIGFLNRRLAAALAPLIDAGVEYDVEVSDVTGSDGEGRSLGVNVLLTRRDLATSESANMESARRRREELASLRPDALDAALVEHLIGDRRLHDGQREALGHLAAGRGCLAVMATGRGKSLIFHLHAARTALTSGGASLFVYPLRALVADQAFHLEESFGEIGLSCRVMTGETSLGERDRVFGELAEGSLDALLTTPEFLSRHAARFAAAGRIRFVVVDEAHHVGMARAGHRPAYGRLGEALDVLGRPTVLAVTATADDGVAGAIRGTLGIEEVVLDATERTNLRLEDRRGGFQRAEEKDAYLASVAASGEKLIVYVNSREQSVRIARALRAKVPELRFRVLYYNGGLTRSSRHAVESAFRSGEITVVVATSAFGEGIDIPDVRHVALYHLPFNDVQFNQTCGRAGRDGADATVHLVFGVNDGRLNEMILQSAAPPREELAALYLVLRDLQRQGEEAIEITNAELAELARKRDGGCRLTDRGVSSALGVFRELGLVTGEGTAAYRRLRVPDPSARVDLASSVRYAEGLEEMGEFAAFREWALSAPAHELLGRFNRPILPVRY